jgi:hypothetical protein
MLHVKIEKASIWLGLGMTVEHGIGSGIGIFVLALAAVKIRFVGLDFMELRSAPLLLRGPFEAYCVTLWLVFAGVYLWV